MTQIADTLRIITPEDPSFAEYKADPVRVLSEQQVVLFRGFKIGGIEPFEAFVKSIDNDDIMTYQMEQARPRTRFGTHTWSSTEYDNRRRISLHNEFPHRMRWPLKIYFYCLKPPASGGRTWLGNNRLLTDRLSESTKAQFRKRGVLYTRHFDSGVGLPLESTFSDMTNEQIQAYCDENYVYAKWSGPKTVELRYRRPAFARHPVTNEELWFNHVFFCNPYSLESVVRRQMRLRMPEEKFPFNSYWGDGEKIDIDILKEIEAAYKESLILFDWQQDDIALLDNMLCTHGREPFEGDRQIRAIFTRNIERTSKDFIEPLPVA